MNPSDFLAELKRRNVYKVAITYAVVAWLLIQIASILLPTFEAPAWVMKALVVFLALGFGLVIFISWAFEATPQGLKRTEDVPADSKLPYWSPRKYAAFVIAVALIAAGLLVYQFFIAGSGTENSARLIANEQSRQSGTSSPEKSIAVLPFENAAHDSETEYLSDGISEALINSLTELQQLKVIARSTVFRYKGKQIDPQNVGRELKVQTVLMGVVRQLGDQLVVQVDLVDTSTGNQLWGQEYDRKLVDVIAVKQTLVREVMDKLRLKLTGEQEQRLARRDTADPQAYQSYLRGRYYWNKRTSDNVRRAIDQFQQAADKDPNYAVAYAGLADCYVLLEDYVGTPASETYSKAKAFAQRALQLDSSLAEAHASLGFVYFGQWEWEKAEQEFRQAIELNPKYATAPHWYSICLLSLGRIDEALAKIKRAHELDPLSSPIGTSLTYAYLSKGDLDAAIAQCKAVIELDPNYPRAHEYLGLGYLKKGLQAESIAEFQKAVQLSGRERRPLRDLGYGYAIAGNHAEAHSVLNELEQKYERREAVGQDLAAVYAGLGEKDQAFAWLEKDLQGRSGLLAWIRWTPSFESLRDDPRYRDLLLRIGLKP